MKKEMLNFFWVLQAFLRGKLLRQKTYRPQNDLFHSMPGGSCARMIKLIRWWGRRPATLGELLARMFQKKESDEMLAPMFQENRTDRVPFVKWTNNSAELKWNWPDDAQNHISRPFNFN